MVKGELNMKKKGCGIVSLILILSAGLGAAWAAPAAVEYSLSYASTAGVGGENPVLVTYSPAEGTISVTHSKENNYFEMDNLDGRQGSILLKADTTGAYPPGTYHPVPDAAPRVVSLSDPRSGNNRYGTATIQFFSGEAPYKFEAGASYAVRFDLIMPNAYHFSTKTGGPLFAFTGSGEAAPAQAADEPEAEAFFLLGYGGTTGGGGEDPVRVRYFPALGTISVAYARESNYFSLNDIDESRRSVILKADSPGLYRQVAWFFDPGDKQESILLKADVSGIYHPLPEITSRIVSVGDRRSGNDYRTLTIQFFDGEKPYQYEKDASYAVRLDLIMPNKYRHSVKPGAALFVFTGSGSERALETLDEGGVSAGLILGYGITTGGGGEDPATVKFFPKTGEISVTYARDSNYFSLNDIDERRRSAVLKIDGSGLYRPVAWYFDPDDKQESILLKADESGIYHPLPEVTSRIVKVGDRRSGNDYRTLAIQFFSGEKPYQYEKDASYAVRPDLIMPNKYHHSVRPGAALFTFTGSGSKRALETRDEAGTSAGHTLGYGITTGGGGEDPATVKFFPKTGEISVTYARDNNYFSLNDIDERWRSAVLKIDGAGLFRPVAWHFDPDYKQESILLKADESEIYHPLPGVTSRIVKVGDRRSGNDYRTLTIQFFKDQEPYQYEKDASYAVRLDLIMPNKYHHSTRTKAAPFAFTGSGKLLRINAGE